MKPADLVFVGLGAAAMSLVTRLAHGGFPGRILIIEPHPQREDDRTWCGWGPSRHPFRMAITRCWHRWAVSAGTTEVITGHRDTPYEMLRSSDVAAIAGQAIDERSDWSLLSGRSLVSAERLANHWRLVLDNGDAIEARQVMDARPPRLTMQRPWVWQSFFGMELTGQDFGADDTLRLMDFVADAPQLTGFFYELPIARDRRLVEFTHFSPQPADDEALRHRVEALVRERGWHAAAVVRSESGHLPMAPIPPYAQSGWMRIGTAGGSMRPATGYAFHAIQQWADTAAHALCTGRSAPPPRRAAYLDWLDGVFLESLWQAPAHAGERFAALFRNTPADALARFLMARPTRADTIKVLRALPVRPMLRAAWHYGWRRR